MSRIDLTALVLDGDTKPALAQFDAKLAALDVLIAESEALAKVERDQRIADIDARILAELERCDRLGVEPGIDHMRLFSERRKAVA